jgi:hypothetical protein
MSNVRAGRLQKFGNFTQQWAHAGEQDGGVPISRRENKCRAFLS